MGTFRLARVQRAAYKPTREIELFLQALAVLYGQTITKGKDVLQLAEYLNLVFTPYKEGSHELTGVLIRKLRGRASLYSVSFYDKRVRLRQKSQFNAVDDTERTTVEENIRLDMTLHAQAIVSLCKAAKDAVSDFEIRFGLREGRQSLPRRRSRRLQSGGSKRQSTRFPFSRETGGSCLATRLASGIAPHIPR